MRLEIYVNDKKLKENEQIELNNIYNDSGL